MFGCDRPPLAVTYLLPPQDCGSFGTSYVGAGVVGVVERDKIMIPKKLFFMNLLREDRVLSSVYNPQRDLALSAGPCV